MTNDMMALRGLMEKSADADLLREMIGYGRAAADEAGGGRPDRGRAWRQEPRAAGAAQRLA
jgi:hypothetical protein